MSGKLRCWSAISILLLIQRRGVLKDLLVLKEAPLRDEHLDEVVDRISQELPVNSVKDLAFHRYNIVSGVPSLYHIVEGIGTRVLDLQELGGD
tara:strand:- start:466 stop:744 length:279 start_codon:yes stop_codon:yes gene_type:complete